MRIPALFPAALVVITASGCAGVPRDPVVIYFPREQRPPAPERPPARPKRPRPTAPERQTVPNPPDGYPETPEAVVRAFMEAYGQGLLEARLEYLGGVALRHARSENERLKKSGDLEKVKRLARSTWGSCRVTVSDGGGMGLLRRRYEAIFHTPKGPDRFTIVLQYTRDRWRIIDHARMPPPAHPPATIESIPAGP